MIQTSLMTKVTTMAKYTETLQEFLNNGNELPSNFNLVEGFDNLFKAHFANYEIGFETEELFSLKLNEKAELYMQAYADKIQRLNNAWENYDDPRKIITDSDATTFVGGKQKGTTAELPINTANVDPSVVNEQDAYTNTNDRTYQRVERGGNVDEAMRMLDFITKEVSSLKEKLLHEFDSCFMVVY